MTDYVNLLAHSNEIKYNYYKTIQYFTHYSFYYTFYLHLNIDNDNAWTTLESVVDFCDLGGQSTALIPINISLNK